MNSTPKWLKRNLERIATVGAIGAVAVGVAVFNLPSIGPGTYSNKGFVNESASHRMMKQNAVMGAAPASISMDMAESFADFADSPPPAAGRRIQETHSFDFVVSQDGVQDAYNLTLSLCQPSFCETNSANLNNDPTYRRADLQLRIDRGRIKSVIQGLEGSDLEISLNNHSRTAQDRTAQYSDIEARMNSQVALKDRLEALIADYNVRFSGDIGDLLSIEREIARVQGQIEAWDAQLRGIRSVTDRVTLNMSFRNEEKVIAETPPYLKNALNEAGKIFERSTANVVRNVAGLTPSVIAILASLFILKLVFRILFGRKKTVHVPEKFLTGKGGGVDLK